MPDRRTLSQLGWLTLNGADGVPGKATLSLESCIRIRPATLHESTKPTTDMIATAKNLVVLARRLWRAREERDRAYLQANPPAWWAAKRRAEHLQILINELILP